jgi:hypothetical protein
MVPPRGPLRSGEGGLDLGCARALSGVAVFLYDQGVSNVTTDNVPLLDPDGPELGGWTSREQR